MLSSRNADQLSKRQTDPKSNVDPSDNPTSNDYINKEVHHDVNFEFALQKEEATGYTHS